MQIGIVGLGRMGANMARRLMRAGHTCVVHDLDAGAMRALEAEGAAGAAGLEELAARLSPPRHVWIMLPAAVVDATIGALEPRLAAGDVVIDGGNSHFASDIRRAKALAARGLHYVDVGTSGGIWGLERGYCMMIGGEEAVVRRLDPVFAALAPGDDGTSPTPGRARGGTEARGYLHCGAAGAGHFVKMVHNGIEYGIMAAYAEGMNLLHAANAGDAAHAASAEVAPLARPEHYRYDIDVGAVAEVWRRGSVIRSWLLDLVAAALAKDPALGGFTGTVSDSGEGRWTVNAAVDVSVPVPVLATALFSRFASRGEDDFANRLLSAMRAEFGGHRERAPR